jgi:cyclase
VVVAIDARKRTDGKPGWLVHVDAGRTPTDRDVIEWAVEAEDRGAGEILLTSMDRDGTKIGFDNVLTAAVADAVGIPVIASGGAGELIHIADAFTEGKADAALAASIFHYGEFTIGEAKEFLRERGITVRI